MRAHHFYVSSKSGKTMSISFVITEIEFDKIVDIAIQLVDKQYQETPKLELLDFRKSLKDRKCEYRSYKLDKKHGFMSLKIIGEKSVFFSDIPFIVNE